MNSTPRKRRKLEFPVAKYRDDGMPAIWLTSDIWRMISSALVREYLDNCERQGVEKAADDSRAPYSLIDCFGAAVSKTDQKTALDLYRIGYEQYEAHRKEYKSRSPAEIIADGVKFFERAYQKRMEELAAWRTTVLIRKLWPHDVTSVVPLSAWSGPNSKPFVTGKVDFSAIVCSYGDVWKEAA